MTGPEVFQIIIIALGETIYMTVVTSIFAFLFGLVLGIVMFITEPDSIYPLPLFNKILGIAINIIRSFPSMILIVVLLPLSRLIVGTSIGTTAAIVPLVIGTAAYSWQDSGKQLERGGKGEIEAAIAMGSSSYDIIRKVIIPEALPSLARGITLSVITIIGASAIAGATGAGGLGAVALRYGYQRFMEDVLIYTVLLMVIIVQAIQMLGDFFARRINAKRYIG